MTINRPILFIFIIKMDLRFKHPFTACLAAGTKCGKTELAKLFVRNAAEMITPPPEEIYWAYGEWQDGYKDLPSNVIMIEGIPDIELFKQTRQTRKLLICDDLMQAYGKQKDELVKLFCQGSHHWNLSIMHLVQNLFFSNLRTARINSHYLILMKNPADRSQIMQVARQIMPTKHKCILEAYDDACSEPFGYLLLDLEPSTPEPARIRTKIFPQDQISYAYLPTGYKYRGVAYK